MDYNAYLPSDGASYHSKKNRRKRKPTRLIPIVEHDLRTMGFTQIDTCELSLGLAVLQDDRPYLCCCVEVLIIDDVSFGVYVNATFVFGFDN